MATVIKAGNNSTGAQVSSDNTGILTIATGTGAGTTAVTVDASQNVGIGVTPANPLQVNGNIVSSDGTTFNRMTRSGGVGLFGTTSNHPIAFQTNDTERMRLDASGNFGVGTSSPGSLFSIGSSAIYGGGTANEPLVNITGAAPSNDTTRGQITLADTKAYNASPLFITTFAGKYNTAGNYTFLSGIGGGKENTTDGNYAGYLGLYSRPHNGNLTERVRITSTGQLLIQGTTANALLANGVQLGNGLSSSGASAYQFLVMPNFTDTDYLSAYNIGSGNNDGRCFSAALAGRNGTGATASLCIGFNAPGGAAITGAIGTASNHPLTFGTNSTTRMTLLTSGILQIPVAYSTTTGSAANLFIDAAGGFYRSTSSIKYKTDVQNTTHGLAEVMQLRAVTYKGKGEFDGDTVFGGLIAEEVHEAGLTEFVQYAEDGTPDALHYGSMVSLAFKAIQEQQAIIDEMKAEIAALKGAA